MLPWAVLSIDQGRVEVVPAKVGGFHEVFSHIISKRDWLCSLLYHGKRRRLVLT